MKNYLFLFLAISLAFSAMGQKNVTKIVRDVPGKTAEIGNVVVFHFVFKNYKDSILRNTWVENAPAEMLLNASVFKGSMEELLLKMSPGDSAIAFVSADSLFEKVYKSEVPSFIGKGNLVKMHVSLLDAMTREAYEEYAKQKRVKMHQSQVGQIATFLTSQNVDFQSTESGLHYVYTQKSNSHKKAQKGDVVTAHYTGYTIDGNVFDSSIKRGTPFNFTLGAGQVIQGWDEIFQILDIGDKATIYLPSQIAYGERGAGQSIPPNAILIFDVELIDAENPEVKKQRLAEEQKVRQIKQDSIILAYMKAQNLSLTKKTEVGTYIIHTNKLKSSKKVPLTYPTSGKKISVHYTGKLLDGKKFDSSVDRNQPFDFTVGAGQVIKGWDDAFLNIAVGQKAIIILPSSIAYGERGAGANIGPNEILLFEIELLEIKE